MIESQLPLDIHPSDLYSSRCLNWDMKNHQISTEDMPLCKCGCGQKIVFQRHHRWLGIPNYVPGHHRRGIHLSIITKMHISRANKGRILSEQHKSNMYKFPKGHVPWNQGKKWSEEHKHKLSQIHTGKVLSEAHKISLRGKTPWNKGLTKDTNPSVKRISQSHKGKILSEVHKQKLSEKKKSLYGNGLIHPMKGKHHSIKIKLKMSVGRMGKSPSHEIRKKISAYHQGIPVEKWSKFISPINKRIRHQLDSRQWKDLVFQRDNYTCQDCYAHGGKLQPHHIKKFSKYPELRFDTNNGITLCTPCHNKTIRKEEQFANYFNKKIQEINQKNNSTLHLVNIETNSGDAK